MTTENNEALEVIKQLTFAIEAVAQLQGNPEAAKYAALGNNFLAKNKPSPFENIPLADNGPRVTPEHDKPKMLNIKLAINEQRITDLLHGHAGGYSPWMHSLIGEWNKDCGALVGYDLEDGEEGEGKGLRHFNREAVQLGLAIFAKESPTHFKQFMEENDDDISFDCAWQCIIFGKLVYA